MVNVKETSNFQEVVLQILKAHEKQGVQPPLDYNDPGMYELRIHEGTGLLLQYHCHRGETVLIGRALRYR
jgi:putative component of toxin-antitoxin plasmid stabilization module